MQRSRWPNVFRQLLTQVPDSELLDRYVLQHDDDRGGEPGRPRGYRATAPPAVWAGSTTETSASPAWADGVPKGRADAAA